MGIVFKTIEYMIGGCFKISAVRQYPKNETQSEEGFTSKHQSHTAATIL
jgi:hypothetical protein